MMKKKWIFTLFHSIQFNSIEFQANKQINKQTKPSRERTREKEFIGNTFIYFFKAY